MFLRRSASSWLCPRVTALQLVHRPSPLFPLVAMSVLDRQLHRYHGAPESGCASRLGRTDGAIQTLAGRLPSGRSAGCGYGLAGQAGVSNPPSPTVSGALPTSRGIRPEIGPPLAAEAGVVSVWLAPSLAVPTQRRGVMPWTCAAAGLAGSSAIPLATASATSTALDRCRRVLPLIIAGLLSGSPTGVTTCRPEGFPWAAKRRRCGTCPLAGAVRGDGSGHGSVCWVELRRRPRRREGSVHASIIDMTL